jgi:hypothetical protein
VFWRNDVLWSNTMKSVPKLKARQTAKLHTTKTPAPQRQPAIRAIDALLDEALVETFPASDAVALTQPSRRRRAQLKRRARASA